MRQGGLGNRKNKDPDMPGETRYSGNAEKAGPTNEAGRRPVAETGHSAVYCHARSIRPRKYCRKVLVGLKCTLRLASGISIAATSTSPVLAQTSGGAISFDAAELIDRPAILLLAVFGGAVSFALLSAFWLIRERGRIGEENRRLKEKYADIRADRDRFASLVEVDDQRIVVWDSSGGKPKILGRLSESSRAPEDRESFLAFGKWLEPGSASRLENAISALRSKGTQFTLDVKAMSGDGIEVQGRVSGGNAFARFIMLEGTRQALARISTDHSALYERFALIEALFEKLPSPVWITNARGELAYTNGAYANAVDCEDSDSAVRCNKQLFDQKERAAIANQLKEAGHYEGTLPAVVAGDRRPLETIGVSTTSGTCGIAIDRSDVEQVRTTLKLAIASHEQTFDHLGTAIAIFDSGQRLQFYNSSFQQLWNLGTGDLEGQPSNSHILEILRDNHQLPEQPDWKRWKEQQLEIYHATETREENWHLADGRTLRVIVNPQNHGGASWVFENVTEELALRSTYNSLVRVQGETLDHLNDAVAVFGSNGKVRLTNPAFQKMWGFEGPQDIEGFHIKEISRQVGERIEVLADWEVICLGVTGLADDRNDFSGRLELKDGTVCDYHLVYLPEGQTMLTLADMTASVNIERALKERNDALEASDALKNRFIQHVSYELRAPLTSISGFTEILASDVPGKLNAKQAEYLDYIATSSEALKSLIDDILDLATIDAGAMELDTQTVDVARVVADSLDQHQGPIERFQLKTDINISGDAEHFVADPLRLSQMLSNLISNAVNVSPDGGRISISIQKQDGMIEIRVGDQGPGIPDEYLESVFQRFETVQGGDRKRGAGLGLSIVKGFAELHGGSVRVESANGKGATFVCRLPSDPAAGLQAAE